MLSLLLMEALWQEYRWIYILVGVREELGVHFGMLFGEQESWEKEENPSATRIVE